MCPGASVLWEFSALADRDDCIIYSVLVLHCVGRGDCTEMTAYKVTVDHRYWCREPVWPSVKALGWQAEGPRFESASALLSLPKLWSVDTVL